MNLLGAYVFQKLKINILTLNLLTKLMNIYIIFPSVLYFWLYVLFGFLCLEIYDLIMF